MLIRSSIIGIAFTLVLVAVLGSARLLNSEVEVKHLTLSEVEVVTLTAPPAPPEFTEPEPEPLADDTPPPPSAPALELPMDVPSLKTPIIAISPRTVSLSTPLQSFHTDRAPAQIPVPSNPFKVPVKPIGNTQSPKNPVSPNVSPKARYSPRDLDKLPKERSKGKFVWPPRARGRQGVVKLLIEIDTSGRVRAIRVISSTNSALNAAAMKVASASRFTVPTYKGKPVKTQFTYSYRLNKPR